MTRFFAPDLSRLPPPDAVQVPDAEVIILARKAGILARIDDPVLRADVAAVLALESEPLVIQNEVGAYRETLVYQRINEAVRACLYSTSTGADLDNLFSWLTIRLSDAATGWVESDPAYKVRIQAALEAFSVAGSEGGYVFYTLSTGGDGRVKDCAVYGPHNTREAVPGDAASAVSIGVPNGHIHIVVLARAGDGYAAPALLADVQREVTPKQRRPLGDWVSVHAATIHPYSVSYRLRVGPGADASLLRQAALDRLTAYVAQQHRVGAVVALTALDAAATGPTAGGLPSVEQVIRLTPTAWVDPGAYGAAWCTAIDVEVEVVDD